MLDLVNERKFSPMPEAPEVSPREAFGGVVEVPLLLSVEQAAALEEAAYSRGLTAAEMVRRLLSGFIADLQGPARCQVS